MSSEPDLVYVALGGAGEIGMNMYLYGHGSGEDRRWIMVDCGVSFPDMETSPGVDLIMADPAFISERADRLDGIFITHAHEDHVGAIGHLWAELQAPIFAREFTAAFVRLKMAEAGYEDATVHVCPPHPRSVQAGPFRVSFVPVSHSIPDASALVIETSAGRVIHTGDFKIDRTPQVGDPFDEAMFWQLAQTRVDALICDSTNVFSTHPGRSEADLAEPIAELVKSAPGLVVATTFASNVARLRTLALAGQAAGRGIAVRGRAMRRMIGLAREHGLIDDFPQVLTDEELLDTPSEHLMVLASGSQGERRAAMSHIASGSNDRLRLGPGDVVLFSSKTIPGNEPAVARVQNRFAETGARVVDESDGLYHVSGHANRPDLKSLHYLLQPGLVVPMHGEQRHLQEHAALARESGFPALIAPNGTMVRIAGGPAEILGEVETGRLYLDGIMLVGALDGVVRERIRLAIRGLVAVSVVIDQNGDLAADPVAEVIGISTDLDDELTDLVAEIEDVAELAIERAERAQKRDDDEVRRVISAACSQLCNRLVGKKPVISVLVSRVEVE
ncbi:MAG: ribonuclease J [Alphaproteobacteria bacterium]|nr:MAG: ribonuclease J [Alphaproteobacteria bacterium]